MMDSAYSRKKGSKLGTKVRFCVGVLVVSLVIHAWGGGTNSLADPFHRRAAPRRLRNESSISQTISTTMDTRGAMRVTTLDSLAEEEEVTIPGYIYAGEITVVIVLSILFEMGQESIRESADEKDELVEALFKELTILGFVGLLVYIVTKSGGAIPLAEALIPGFTGAGDENPLQESFEMIHMVIFCVMIVFIFQALALMEVSRELVSKWNLWENVHSVGTAGSIEFLLKEYGYLDRHGNKSKRYIVPKTLHRMVVQSDIHALLQWRALRHEFLFPSIQEAGELHNVIYVKDAASFDFEMYLGIRLKRIFIDLVEVDGRTWVVGLLLINPLVMVGQSLNAFDVCFLQAIIAWFLFCCAVLILYDLTRILGKLTPELSSTNPEMIIRYFSGTSQAELRRIRQAQKRRGLGDDATVTSEWSQPGREEEKPFTGGRLPPINEKSGDESPRTLPSPISLSSLSPTGRRSVVFVPPLHQHQHKRTRPERSRFYMPLVGGKPSTVPNSQQQLYFFQEQGLEFYTGVLEMIVFFQAVSVASLVVVFFLQPITTDLQRGLICLAWLEWPIMLFCVLPRVISIFCMLLSIEFEKDKEAIKDVIFKVKHERLQEALEVLKLVKLRGRAQKLGGSHISAAEFKKAQQKFKTMPKEKQEHYKNIFRTFDVDGSGTIDEDELGEVLQAIGIVQGSDASLAASELVSMCDLTGNKCLSLEEFKVLIVLSMEKRTIAEEKADMRAFFQQIDTDGGGTLTIEEIHSCFANDLNCDLSPEFISTLVHQCFKEAKIELDEKEFIIWLRHLEGGEEGDEDSESSCESMESVSSYSTGYTTSVNTMERLSVTAMKERPTSSSALDDTKKKSVIFTDRY
eukprot:GEMP01002559.1.p1 GENE.GEMP01002559.1~~GEMP01002559.1.p1  ORF type:complete len:858 (+),score=180.68 GEMP01002559.1:128-2701(+)